MGLFFDTAEILNKIWQSLPSNRNPAVIRGMSSKFKDDFVGNSLSAANWEVISIGQGQSISVNNSVLTVSAGVLGGITKLKSRQTFSIPCQISFGLLISQRIAGQKFKIEFIDPTGSDSAAIEFSGTNNGSMTPLVSTGGISGLIQNVTSTGTNNNLLYQIDIGVNQAQFSQQLLDASTGNTTTIYRQKNIPDPALEYYIQITVENISPASSTTFSIDHIAAQSRELISIELLGSRGRNAVPDAIPIVGAVGSILNIGGTVNATISSFDSATYTTETIAALGANATFTGASRNTSSRKNLCVFATVDQPGTLFIDWSFDQSVWHLFSGFPCTPGTPVIVRQETMLQYYRIRYINGSVAANPKIYSLLRFL